MVVIITFLGSELAVFKPVFFFFHSSWLKTGIDVISIVISNYRGGGGVYIDLRKQRK